MGQFTAGDDKFERKTTRHLSEEGGGGWSENPGVGSLVPSQPTILLS
jgi:hypothetical protein